MKLDLSQAGMAKAREEKKEQVLAALNTLVKKNGAGNDFLGWVDLPEQVDQKELSRIREAAKRIHNEAEALVVIGIGGSYLGARAVIEALSPSYEKGKPEILFAGNQLSAEETVELLAHLKGKTFAINVISKSGTTTEPAVAFRHFKALLEENVGKEKAKSFIFATTDRKRGALKTLADAEGYETFVVPDGGVTKHLYGCSDFSIFINRRIHHRKHVSGNTKFRPCNGILKKWSRRGG